MKVFAVVEYVDLGYHVIKAFYDRLYAEKKADRLNLQRYEETIENCMLPDIMTGETRTYEESQKYVDTFFNWTYYSIEEFEVE